MKNRFLLAIFKLCAIVDMLLVPFYIFYDSMEDFIRLYMDWLSYVIRKFRIGVHNFKVELELLMRGK